MTVFFLIRHALHSLGGETIAGRLPDVHLSPGGQAQAAHPWVLCVNHTGDLPELP